MQEPMGDKKPLPLGRLHRIACTVPAAGHRSSVPSPDRDDLFSGELPGKGSGVLADADDLGAHNWPEAPEDQAAGPASSPCADCRPCGFAATQPMKTW